MNTLEVAIKSWPKNINRKWIKKTMQNKKIKLFLFLVFSWVFGLFVILVGGRVLLSLTSCFLVGEFDFCFSDLIKGVEISIGSGFIIGGGQFIMSKEES
ncbi:hypothetical protein QM637_22200 [Pantoea allii]|uniref:hypothetical protein n=1 Tax=Pantoea allii TaxID=574096 RepID=UPI0024B6877B|nr:hypothetical protein [Pantoea allii]MDJ0038525.1 hypothetical protein [Pantoea allii]